jgi:putative anticodon-binding protein
VPLGAIAGVTALGESHENEIATVMASNRVDPDAAKKREDAAVQALKEKESNRNRGASKEGQAIFDHFFRQ